MFNRTVMLTHHLQHNHFPPISADFVPVAEAAIDAASMAVIGGEVVDEEALDTVLALPNGHEHTVREVMEALHLWDFIAQAEADEDFDSLAVIVDLDADEDDDQYVDEDVARGDR